MKEILGQKKIGSYPKMVTFVVISLAIIVVGSLIYARQIEPLHSLNKIDIGMREVDVTLRFGRNPDCSNIKDPDRKTVEFNGGGQLCATVVHLKKIAQDFRVMMVCSTTIWPFDNIDSWAREPELIRRLGSPSHTSISGDGTTKILNFPRYNVALEFRGERVINSCVTKNFPIAYNYQYEG